MRQMASTSTGKSDKNKTLKKVKEKKKLEQQRAPVKETVDKTSVRNKVKKKSKEKVTEKKAPEQQRRRM